MGDAPEHALAVLPHSAPGGPLRFCLLASPGDVEGLRLGTASAPTAGTARAARWPSCGGSLGAPGGRVAAALAGESLVGHLGLFQPDPEERWGRDPQAGLLELGTLGGGPGLAPPGRCPEPPGGRLRRSGPRVRHLAGAAVRRGLGPDRHGLGPRRLPAARPAPLPAARLCRFRHRRAPARGGSQELPAGARGPRGPARPVRRLPGPADPGRSAAPLGRRRTPPALPEQRPDQHSPDQPAARRGARGDLSPPHPTARDRAARARAPHGPGCGGAPPRDLCLSGGSGLRPDRGSATIRRRGIAPICSSSPSRRRSSWRSASSS